MHTYLARFDSDLCVTTLCLVNEMDLKERLQVEGAREITCNYKYAVSFVYDCFGDYGWSGISTIELQVDLMLQTSLMSA